VPTLLPPGLPYRQAQILRAGLVVSLGEPFEREFPPQAAQSLPSSSAIAAQDLRGSGIIEHGLETGPVNTRTQSKKINRLAIVGDVAMEVADPTVVLAKAAPFLRESAIAFGCGSFRGTCERRLFSSK